MKLSNERTAVPSPSHVDLDAITAVYHAILTGQVSAHEARVATALILNPELTGLRSIERASGLADDTVLKVLPANGESSTLLECSSRGVFAWEAEDRRPMDVGYRSSVEHNKISNSLKENYVQEIPQEMKGAEEIEGVDARRMTGFLDPSLDLWANVENGLGDAGWVLAMATRLRETTFTLDELKKILRLGERQVRRVVEKLGSWARKTRVGRAVLVTVDFSAMVEHEEMAELCQSTSRRDRKARQHSYEADVVREMASEVGRLAKEMWQNRLAEVRQLRTYVREIPGLVHDRLLNILEGPLSSWEALRALRQHLSA